MLISHTRLSVAVFLVDRGQNKSPRDIKFGRKLGKYNINESLNLELDCNIFKVLGTKAPKLNGAEGPIYALRRSWLEILPKGRVSS